MFRAYAKRRLRGSGPALLTLVLLVLLGITGCATNTVDRTGPAAPAAVRHEPWDAKYPRTRCLITAHYQIYTDLENPEVLDQLSQLMEGAFSQYQMLTPGAPLSPQPLRCYIFAGREQWAAFTAKNTGEDAAIYLKIARGAYTVDDWFVAFWLGDRATCAVAAHEGWHQFAARNYAGRMAPAIEEGIACMFEDVEWEGTLPRWNIGTAPSRRRMLERALSSNTRWPLGQLLQLHAGDVISLPRQRIDTFYAQTWALAMFLWEGEGGRFRPAFQQYLSDVAAGRAYRPRELAHLTQREWHPAMAGAQLPHYLGLPLAEIDQRYQHYCRTLARGDE